MQGGGQLKQTQGGCSFIGSQKTQSNMSNSSIINNSTNNKGVVSAVSHQDKTPSSSAPSVSANHGQRQRVVGGANQSLKAGNGWLPSGTLATSTTTSHLSQVSVWETRTAFLTWSYDNGVTFLSTFFVFNLSLGINSRHFPPGQPLHFASGLWHVGRPGARLAALPVPPVAQFQPSRNPRGCWHGLSPQLQLRIPSSTERPNG